MIEVKQVQVIQRVKQQMAVNYHQNLMSWNCLSCTIFASATANPEALKTWKEQKLELGLFAWHNK